MLLSRANELLVGGVGHRQTAADRNPYDLLSTPHHPQIQSAMARRVCQTSHGHRGGAVPANSYAIICSTLTRMNGDYFG